MKFLQYIFLIKILLISTQNIQNNTLYKCNSSNSEGLKIEKDSNGLHFSFLQPLQLSSQTISKIFPSFTLITKLNKGTNSS